MTKTVILGVIGSDAHVVGITIPEQALEAAGFDVANLGAEFPGRSSSKPRPPTTPRLYFRLIALRPRQQDCDGFHQRIAESDIDVTTYIGGNLAVGQDDF